MVVRVTKKALAAKAADANKAVALKAAGLAENATAAEVVKLFKQTIGEGEKSVRDIMRKLAELAGLLVEGYGLTQEQVAEKVGRSQPWVSGILRWRRDGYKLVAFGPETHKPKLLPANNPAPAPQAEAIRTATGDKIDTSQFSPKAQEQLARITGSQEIPIEQRQAEMAKLAGEEPVTSAEPVETFEGEAQREVTAEELSDDHLSAFKKACEEHCPAMSEADQKKARVYFNENKWMPRATKKAA